MKGSRSPAVCHACRNASETVIWYDEGEQTRSRHPGCRDLLMCMSHLSEGQGAHRASVTQFTVAA